jgi:hypothetical protein
MLLPKRAALTRARRVGREIGSDDIRAGAPRTLVPAHATRLSWNCCVATDSRWSPKLMAVSRKPRAVMSALRVSLRTARLPNVAAGWGPTRAA